MLKKYKDLQDFIAIKSISAAKDRQDDCVAAAEWLVDYLKRNGIDSARLLEGKGLPLVYADIKADKSHGSQAKNKKSSTLLFYGHYDVEDVDRGEAWQTDPFKLTIVKDRFVARGIADDKGQIMAFLEGLVAAKNAGELAYNVKLLIEGEEEIVSLHNADNLKIHKKLLNDVEFVLVADSDMQPDRPQITIGLRGITVFKLKLWNALDDLHSGEYGGAVMNPATILAKIMDKFIDEDGYIEVPGFYEDIIHMGEKEMNRIEKNNPHQAMISELTGAKAFWEEGEFDIQHNQTIRPTFDVNGFHSGAHIKGMDMIIPARAEAIFSFRLVAKQRPERIERLVNSFIKKLIPKDMKYELKLAASCDPILFPADLPIFKDLAKAAKGIWKKPLQYNYSGGSIGIIADFKKILGLDSIITGVIFPDAHLHGANENMPVEQYEKGVEFYRRYLSSLPEFSI